MDNDIRQFFDTNEIKDIETHFQDFITSRDSVPTPIKLITRYKRSYNKELKDLALQYLFTALTEDLDETCADPRVIAKLICNTLAPNYTSICECLADFSQLENTEKIFMFLLYYLSSLLSNKKMIADDINEYEGIKFICSLERVNKELEHEIYWGIVENEKDLRKVEPGIELLFQICMSSNNINLINCLNDQLNDNKLSDEYRTYIEKALNIYNQSNGKFNVYKAFKSNVILPFFLEGAFECYLYSKHEPDCLLTRNKEVYQIRQLHEDLAREVKSVTNFLHTILYNLVRDNKMRRNNFIKYIKKCYAINLERYKMMFERKNYASDGFCFNFCNVLDKFCDKIILNRMEGKIDFDYINRLDFEASKEKFDIKDIENIQIDSKYNLFITTMFTYNILFMNISYVKFLEEFELLSKRIHYLSDSRQESIQAKIHAYRIILFSDIMKDKNYFIDFMIECAINFENLNKKEMHNKEIVSKEIIHKVETTNIDQNSFKLNKEEILKSEQKNFHNDKQLRKENNKNDCKNIHDDVKINKNENLNKNIEDVNNEKKISMYENIFLDKKIGDLNDEDHTIDEKKRRLEMINKSIKLRLCNVYYLPICCMKTFFIEIYSNAISKNLNLLFEKLLNRGINADRNTNILRVLYLHPQSLSKSLFFLLCDIYGNAGLLELNDRIEIRTYINGAIRNDYEKNIRILDKNGVKFVSGAIKDLETLLSHGINAISNIKQDLLTLKKLIIDTNNEEENTEVQEIKEKLKRNENLAKGSFSCVYESFEMILYIALNNLKLLTFNETKILLVNTLNYNLKLLVGPTCSSLSIENMSKYKFNPKELLCLLCTIYSELKNKDIQKSIVTGKDFNINFIKRAYKLIIEKKLMKGHRQLEKLTLFYNEITELAEEQLKDENTFVWPEDLCDPLTFEVMENPVKLLTSNITIDRSTFDMIMVGDGIDPFNREKIDDSKIIVDNDMKKRIEEYRKSKNA
ncbi:Ubiquitin conjugation factor E4 [Conglomerata obtusa]